MIATANSSIPPIWDALYNEMIEKIDRIGGEEKSKVDQLKQAVNVCGNSINDLKQYVLSNAFSSPVEEIYFFKNIKPRFHAQLLYYLKLYHLEINWPTGSKLAEQEYLMRQFERLKVFFENHTSFYHYYRSGASYMDDVYFIRHKVQARQINDFLYIDADPSFSTIYDYQVARILTNDMLCKHLNDLIELVDQKSFHRVINQKPALEWSHSKVAFAELLYALHASGVFNNSQTDIKTISDYLCRIFNVKIGNIYKIFEEIRVRKKNRTAFLDSLRENVIQRMERDDQQAL